MSAPLPQLRHALSLVQAGHQRQALAVVEAVLAASGAPGNSTMPDGILPWLNLARDALAAKEAAVPPFLALQTAIVLLEV